MLDVREKRCADTGQNPRHIIMGIRKNGSCDYGKREFPSEPSAHAFLDMLKIVKPKTMEKWIAFFILPKS